MKCMFLALLGWAAAAQLFTGQVALGGSAAAVRAQTTRRAETSPTQPTAKVRLPRQSPNVPPQAPPAERWRYRFYNGHWWYWRGGGRWAYWSGKQWHEYEADSYTRWRQEQELERIETELARLKAQVRTRGRGFTYRGGHDPDSFKPFQNAR